MRYGFALLVAAVAGFMATAPPVAFAQDPGWEPTVAFIGAPFPLEPRQAAPETEGLKALLAALAILGVLVRLLPVTSAFSLLRRWLGQGLAPAPPPFPLRL